ncbi:MAG: hypothetical protein ACE5J9_03910 [Methanosarcinales archaeon]
MNTFNSIIISTLLVFAILVVSPITMASGQVVSVKNYSADTGATIDEIYTDAFYEVKEEYLEKLEKIRKKGEFETFSNIEDLRRSIIKDSMMHKFKLQKYFL